MTEFFATGRAVDVILAVMVLEAVLLATWRRGDGKGFAVADIVFALLPGAMLLLALRGALVHASWVWIAVCLALAFPAHLIDLARRRRAAGSVSGRDAAVG